MCGPKYCPMHNFRDVDWDSVAAAIEMRKRERAGAA
jgi:phosphomethylpyrimidine synthase